MSKRLEGVDFGGLEGLDSEDLLSVVDFCSDVIERRKQPQRTIGKRTLLSELRECHRKVWYSTTRHANKRAKNLSSKYKVGFRVYACTTCNGYHLTTQLKEKL